MNLYEHTLIARQDTSPSQIKQLQEKYTKIIESNEGNIIKFESWGLLHLSYLIKKNKKGNYLHFKIEGNGKTIKERGVISIFPNIYTFQSKNFGYLVGTSCTNIWYKNQLVKQN